MKSCCEHKSRACEQLRADFFHRTMAASSTGDADTSSSSHAENPVRAALVFSGFLRGTCHGEGMQAMVNQAAMCREVFGGNCNIFIHSWSTTHKDAIFKVHHSNMTQRVENILSSNHSAYRRAASAWPCVPLLARAVETTSITLEEQKTPSMEALARVDTWGAMHENLMNFRWQIASVHAGLGLMSRHAAMAHVRFHAVVRMRADLGERSLPQSWRETFLKAAGWRTVRRRADLLARGALDAKRASEIVTCGRLRFKYTDFCQWSVPASALERTIDALGSSTASFERVVYGGDGREPCAHYLNRTDNAVQMRIPPVSENIMYCAMNAAGTRPALSTVDVKPNAI